ncbi:MAG: YlbF family regulator [Alicyclobacillus sp.]|nr:YlbF family regulator [Alicyclobacillus sp.]
MQTEDWMRESEDVTLDRNELWAETEELADLIMQAPEIQAFHDAEARLKANPQALSMMNRLRELQEQIGEFRARNVPPMHFVHLMQESESLLEKLETLPEVAAFQRAQTDVNDLLQSVTSRLAQAVLQRVDGNDVSAAHAGEDTDAS